MAAVVCAISLLTHPHLQVLAAASRVVHNPHSSHVTLVDIDDPKRHPLLPCFDARLFLFLVLIPLMFASFSRSFAERSGFGGGGLEGNVLEAIDGTSQWLLRSALRSRRARFGLIIYAMVLQVTGDYAI